MKKNLVIVGGGRNKDKRKASMEAMHGLAIFLSNFEYNIMKLWWDEHGVLWRLEGEDYILQTIVAGSLVRIVNEELCIGEKGVCGEKIDIFWPLIGGEEYGYCGISGWAKMNGVEKIIGVNGLMLNVGSDIDLLKLMIDVPIIKKLQITKQDWIDKRDKYLDLVNTKFKFPIKISNVNNIPVFNQSDMIERCIYAFGNNMEMIELEECWGNERDLRIGFIGKNFLPSKLCEKIDDEVKIFDLDNKTERDIQDLLIKLVKNFDVGEVGCLYLKYDVNQGWKLEKIDFYPDLSRNGLFIKMWQLSGVEYEFVINRILNN